MDSQPSIQPYERLMPKQPAGMVPTTGRPQTLALEQSKLPHNPLPVTKTNLENGQIYYGYYCKMCHGASGRGDGPVGDSYVPKPADLTSVKIRSMTDGKLYYAMLHGMGHDPVMEETVQPGRRWQIVIHVRAIGATEPHPSSPRGRPQGSAELLR